MRRLVALVVVACSLAFVGTAFAVEGYGGPRYWYPGDSAGSSWSGSWYRNQFNKEHYGWDTTVTFIDNVSYAWHATVRNKEMVTYNLWFSSHVKKAHCKANSGFHWGGCYVVS